MSSLRGMCALALVDLAIYQKFVNFCNNMSLIYLCQLSEMLSVLVIL